MSHRIVPFLWLIGCLFGFGLGACTDDDRTAVETAEEEVAALHDAVMPRLSELSQYQKQVQTRLANLDTLNAPTSAEQTLRTAETRDQGQRLLRHLREADSLMTHWMQQYNADTLQSLSNNAALDYLQRQKDVLTDVQTRVDNSLHETQTWLANP